jgi:hypothetical protein
VHGHTLVQYKRRAVKRTINNFALFVHVPCPTSHCFCNRILMNALQPRRFFYRKASEHSDVITRQVFSTWQPKCVIRGKWSQHNYKSQTELVKLTTQKSNNKINSSLFFRSGKMPNVFNDFRCPREGKSIDDFSSFYFLITSICLFRIPFSNLRQNKSWRRKLWKFLFSYKGWTYSTQDRESLSSLYIKLFNQIVNNNQHI